MSDPRNETYQPTAAGSYTDPRLADRQDLPGAEHQQDRDHDGYHEGHHHELHDHDHEHPRDEHEHELTTTGVDVDAALERVVEHEI